VTEAIRFLRTYNIRGSVPVGRDVIVIGGGNAAVDAARTALRLGAKTVTILYRRTREEMPAYAEEIEEAEHEGVKLQLLTAPEAIVVKDGKVAGLQCRRMKLGAFDRSGRRRPEADPAGPSIFPADQIIAAVGQSADFSRLLAGVEGVKIKRDGYIEIHPTTGQTTQPWLFAGGDAVNGPSSVIDAVSAGERAAAGIDHLLSGAWHAFWRDPQAVVTSFNPDAEPEPFAREKLPLVAVDRRRFNFDEVEQPWVEAVAVRQARRCLRCDYGKNVQSARE
jgi:NADH-quinone oxidoreductase subunit F